MLREAGTREGRKNSTLRHSDAAFLASAPVGREGRKVGRGIESAPQASEIILRSQQNLDRFLAAMEVSAINVHCIGALYYPSNHALHSTVERICSIWASSNLKSNCDQWAGPTRTGVAPLLKQKTGGNSSPINTGRKKSLAYLQLLLHAPNNTSPLSQIIPPLG
jgi:hypothetical protein